MTYKIERRSRPEVIVTTWKDDFDYRLEIDAFSEDIEAQLDEEAIPISVIIDMGMPDMTIGDIFNWAKMARQGETSFVQHSQLSSALWVTQNPMLIQTLDRLNSIPFHSVNVHTFLTLEEAIKHVTQSPL